MDPGQALRNDGLDPPRPPTLGGRLRESGIQAAETVIAGAAAGAAAATRSVSENQTMNVLRGGGDWLDRTLRIPRRPPGLAPPPDEVPAPQIIGRPSEVEPLLQRAGQRAAEVERQAAQDIERFASQQMAEAEATEAFASAAECGGGGGRGRHGLGDRAGLGRRDGRRHGQRRLAALPSHGCPDFERGAGFRRRGSLLHPRAAAFRIDTDSESEPRAQPQQQIRARPIRRQGQGRQQPTPFGINQVPIPVSSGSERSRISRQSRGDRGPLATPSFDALRTASEPEAA